MYRYWAKLFKIYIYTLELENIPFGTKLVPTSKIQVNHISISCDQITKLQFWIWHILSDSTKQVIACFHFYANKMESLHLGGRCLWVTNKYQPQCQVPVWEVQV